MPISMISRAKSDSAVKTAVEVALGGPTVKTSKIGEKSEK